MVATQTRCARLRGDRHELRTPQKIPPAQNKKEPSRMNATIRAADYRETLAAIHPSSVSLILTDPPYTISRPTGFTNTKVAKYSKLHMSFGEWDSDDIDMHTLSALSYVCLINGGSIVVWCDWHKLSDLSNAMSDAGFTKLRVLMWEKTNPVPVNSQVTYLSNAREFAVSAIKGSNATFNAVYHPGVWRYPIPRPTGGRLHPTQKPIELFKDLILIHTNESDLVCDPFLGSGTTAVASIAQGRRFIGGDADPNYCEVAKERLARETDSESQITFRFGKMGESESPIDSKAIEGYA